MSEKKLKPCPFCGSLKLFIGNTVNQIYMIRCYSCGAVVSFVGSELREKAFIAWNRRDKK